MLHDLEGVDGQYSLNVGISKAAGFPRDASFSMSADRLPRNPLRFCDPRWTLSA